MILNIRTKIIFIIIFILLFSIITIILTTSNFFVKEYSAAVQSRTFAIAQSLKLQLDRLLELGIPLEQIVGFEKQCKDITDKYEDISYAMVLNLDGRILFHSDPSQHDKILTDPVFLSNLKSAKENVQDLTIKGKSYYNIMIPIFDDYGQHIGAVSVGFPVELITERTSKLIIYSIVVACISFIIALVLGVFLSNSISRPIRELTDIIENISTGKLDVEINPKLKESKDEIGKLAQAFDRTIVSLKLAMKQSGIKYSSEIKGISEGDLMKECLLKKGDLNEFKQAT